MVADQIRRSHYTPAQQDYLKTLYNLGGDQRAVSTNELAQRLRISAASVSEMVGRLSEQGLVAHDDSDRLRELQRRGLMPGTRLQIRAGSEYESPIEAQMGRRRVSVPLGLAREVFVEQVVE